MLKFDKAFCLALRVWPRVAQKQEMATNMGLLLRSMINLPVYRVGFAKNTASRLIYSSTQGEQIKHDGPGEHDARTLGEKEKVNNKNDGKSEVEGDDDGEGGVNVNKNTGEIGGPKGPEPTRYGDWERGGRCSDF